jgi:hypothetical protein
MAVADSGDWQSASGNGDVVLLVETLQKHRIPWCVIGDVAVNHWAKAPTATADIDVVIAADRAHEALHAIVKAGFRAEWIERTIHIKGKSEVSMRITTTEFYSEFPERAVLASVHGIPMRVASLHDTLQGKIGAWRDPQRRPSKRQKDLTDIQRLVEAQPELYALLPEDVQAKIKQA